MDAPAQKPWWRERRYHIVAVCFLATFTMYVERQGFSIAFTAMARTAAIDEEVKGSVFSDFYWGYGLSQVGCSSGSFLLRTALSPLWVAVGGWSDQARTPQSSESASRDKVLGLHLDAAWCPVNVAVLAAGQRQRVSVGRWGRCCA